MSPGGAGRTGPTRRPGDGVLGAALIALAAICFSTLGPLTRFAAEAGVGSLSIVAWRAGLGGGAMIVLLLLLRGAAGRPIRGRTGIPPRQQLLVLAGALAGLILNLAMFIAFVRIEIGLALLVFYLYPAIVAALSVLWFGARLDALRWSALGVSVIGLVLTLVGAGGLGSLDAGGIALAFIAAMAQAFFVLAARHGFASIPPIEAAAVTMGLAAVGYVVIATLTGNPGQLAEPVASGAALLPVLAAGLLGAAVPTLCFITGIRLLGPPRAAILATLEPVMGIALSAWLLGEQPTALQLFGGALVLAAAALLQLPARGAVVADHEAVGA